jgi:hypothetical protein
LAVVLKDDTANQDKQKKTDYKQKQKSKNMRKVTSFMHISLDGIVAGPNGGPNWAKVDQYRSWLRRKDALPVSSPLVADRP